MRKKKYTEFGRGFLEPFDEPNYFEKHSFYDVLKEIKKDIVNHAYKFTRPILTKGQSGKRNPNPDSMSTEDFVLWRTEQELNKISHVKLTEYLISCAHYCPDLFENEAPLARKLVGHFGRLLNQFYYGTKAEGDEAKTALEMIMNRPEDARDRKKDYIPPLLSLNDMFEYLHKITIHLKKKYKKLKGKIKGDDQFKGIKEEDFGLLTGAPKTFTKKIMADFFGLQVDTLKKYMEEEKRHPNTYHPENG